MALFYRLIEITVLLLVALMVMTVPHKVFGAQTTILMPLPPVLGMVAPIELDGPVPIGSWSRMQQDDARAWIIMQGQLFCEKYPRDTICHWKEEPR